MYLVREKIQRLLDDFKLKKKLQSLYIVCVILPLFLTDGFILYNMLSAEKVERQHEMENLASALQYNIYSTFMYASSTADSINLNKYIEEFLNTQYETPLAYVEGYQDFMRNSLLASSMAITNTKVTIYADNETIINGGEFGRISTISGTEWYQTLKSSEEDAMLLFYYDDLSPSVSAKRKILLLRKMNLVSSHGCEKVIKIEIDYNKMIRDINGMNYESPVYICKDGKILLSNTKDNYQGQPFKEFTLMDKVGYQTNIILFGETYQIYVLEKDNDVWLQILSNIPLILFLLFINILLPSALMSQIERSITVRIGRLGEAFDSVNADELTKIPEVSGSDEIAALMRNYNRMADRTNGLIQTVYKDKLREQEMSIAQKNAELLALYGQINPHFLFNALESIRMHSVLKKEYETADMVEKLALMERQNVDWGNDSIEISKEMDFVEAYLSLQKYRFGDRLSYSLEVEPECEALKIPKLTIVTFAENACVHGIESKTAPGWIFIRIYKEEGFLCIEVEDTGKGMSEELVCDIQDKMDNANIERLKQKERVGILNACLRLKMMTDNQVYFSVESESDVGTIIQIRIPQDRLS
ncbi:MAG: histidine kinase [Roseburia sp.]|nr:histidine kinase [Roseburia sp.]MCM1241972.1 histidine kinase [Roseburia sp.]